MIGFARMKNAYRKFSNVLRGANTSFSQEGEDLLLARFMPVEQTGIYIDVGANHPLRCSNTAALYQRGWSGLAIDPNPDFLKPYSRIRPRDTYVNCGIGDSQEQLTYHRFKQPLYNTLDNERRDWLVSNGKSELLESVQVPIRSLADVVESIWPEGRTIQFLSIDCEGMDAEVLCSHNFEKYPVDVLCVETDAVSLQDFSESEISQAAQGFGFIPISKLWKSVLFLSEPALKKLDQQRQPSDNANRSAA